MILALLSASTFPPAVRLPSMPISARPTLTMMGKVDS